NVAVDPAGRVWDLRGIDVRSAANGDTVPNRDWCAVLFLVGPGEEPTAAQVEAFRHWRVTRWLRKFPKATQVTTHQKVRPAGTECPGPAVIRLVQKGELGKPPTTGEDDMAAP